MAKPKITLKLLVSKSDSAKTELIDGLRILAWKTFKRDRVPGLKDRGDKDMLEVYKEYFAPEWQDDHDQLMTLTYEELVKFISEEFQYSEAEILMLRAESIEYKKQAAKEASERKQAERVPLNGKSLESADVPF